MHLTHGLLVVDDTTLDKPYAQKMGLVSRHWSGKHHAVVEGISLTTLLWTDGLSSLPCDCRLYEVAAEGEKQVTKNDHFVSMLHTAKERGFRPKYICFDGWYSSLENLKAVRGHGWHFLTRLKSNRQVNPDNTGNVAVSDIEVPEHGRTVHLKGFGFIQVFRTVAPNGDVEHWATDDLKMEAGERRDLSRPGVRHRELPPCLEAVLAVWSGRRCGAQRPRSATSCCPCGRLYAWKRTAGRRASAATPPKRASFGRQFGCICRTRPFFWGQLRKSYKSLCRQKSSRRQKGVTHATFPQVRPRIRLYFD